MSLSLSRGEVAALLEVPLPPSRELPGGFTEVSAIDGAGRHAIVFATDAPTLAAALASDAGMILCGASGVGPAGSSGVRGGDARVLVVPDARRAFAVVARALMTPTEARYEPAAEIDPQALVEAGAVLGPGCRVAAGAFIARSVRMGRGCEIGPRAVVHAGSTLGERVRVQAGAVLGADGFGYVREPAGYLRFPQIGTLSIGDDVEIGANTTIDRGALGETRIGRGTKIDNLVHIAHNCVIGEDVLIAAQAGLAGSCTIGNGAMLGGQSGLGEHVTIGPGVILGGQGGVLPGKSLTGPGVVFWGTPARPVREYLRDVARMRRGGSGGRS